MPMFLSTFEVAFISATIGIDHGSKTFLLAVDVPAFIDIAIRVNMASKSMRIIVLEVPLKTVTRLPNSKAESVLDLCPFLNLAGVVVLLSVSSLGRVHAHICQFFHLEVEPPQLLESSHEFIKLLFLNSDFCAESFE